ncbi:MAG TPA: hypothetical protein DEB17_00370 [Chlorobaculum sp.]|uniref:Uncharacterized protein n=1 Tax=Chlorobaculum tepidum (strain ATCC 49652 / DSM 12025 / NBRC 103806 / TLS) TaxID=194439 RepID=Q8KC26_CHLTE|nr:hypothetical protein CT1600 [Chlorobaculum tepidum TLS]HBU22453.1 hypothetical protein [Chlorobaculum sp.]
MQFKTRHPKHSMHLDTFPGLFKLERKVLYLPVLFYLSAHIAA